MNDAPGREGKTDEGGRGGCGGKTDRKERRERRALDANIDLQLHLRENGSIAAATSPSALWGFGSASRPPVLHPDLLPGKKITGSGLTLGAGRLMGFDSRGLDYVVYGSYTVRLVIKSAVASAAVSQPASSMTS